MGKIYIVGEKASYVHGGRSYKPGDEINGDLFKKEGLEAAIKGGRLVEKKKESVPPPGNGKKALDDMTLAELKDYAAEKKIPIAGSKAEILAAIKEAEKKAPGSGGKFDALSDEELMALAAEKGIDPAIGRVAILEALNVHEGGV
jgi:hypothetical protein